MTSATYKAHANSEAVRVFLVCSGLGRINRGFESFAQECFFALSTDQRLAVTLFQGGGATTKKRITLWNLPRTSPLAQHLGKYLGRGGYQVEQWTFCLSLLPWILRGKPHVIFYSDGNIGRILSRWRCFMRLQFRLLYSNGGPLSPPFPSADLVQQVAPIHLQAAIKAGEPQERQCFLPYGIHMSPTLQTLSAQERWVLRASLDLPQTRPIVLSVGAVNTVHKRMDYVVSEVAALPSPRPFLLILGQQEEETAEVQRSAIKLLGEDGFDIRTVPNTEIGRYYQAANMFVLASLNEGFGRVFLEAMSHGLPCLGHDYELTRFILGNTGLLANLAMAGSLTGLISAASQQEIDASLQRQRYASCYTRFSWEQLRSDYVKMILQCAQV